MRRRIQYNLADQTEHEKQPTAPKYDVGEAVLPKEGAKPNTDGTDGGEAQNPDRCALYPSLHGPGAEEQNQDDQNQQRDDHRHASVLNPAWCRVLNTVNVHRRGCSDPARRRGDYAPVGKKSHAIFTRAFTQLNRSRQLIAVDWRQHILPAGAAADDNITVW
jgi:hypothetical protein